MKLLDLFCGGGGCSVGYERAGFDVVGVDIEPQKNYPYTFYQCDAIMFPLEDFDIIHASPPCQAFTNMLNHGLSSRDKHPNLINTIRRRLQTSGKPYVIENVVGAPLEKAIMLCGAMFGLRVYRHRLFESNMFLWQPEHSKHTAKAAHAGMIPKHNEFYCPVGHFADKKGSLEAMGIDWMDTTREIAQAIPPIYTEYIGKQLLEQLK